MVLAQNNDYYCWDKDEIFPLTFKNNKDKPMDYLPTIRLIQGYYPSQFAMQYAAFVYLKEKMAINVEFYPANDPNSLFQKYANYTYWCNSTVNMNASRPQPQCSIFAPYPQFYFEDIKNNKYDLLFEIWDIMMAEGSGSLYFSDNSVILGGISGIWAETGWFIPSYVYKNNPEWLVTKQLKYNQTLRQIFIDSYTIYSDKNYINQWYNTWNQKLNDYPRDFPLPTNQTPIIFGSKEDYLISVYSNRLTKELFDGDGLNWTFVALGSEGMLTEFIMDLYSKELPFIANLYSPHLDFATMVFQQIPLPRNPSNSISDGCYIDGECAFPFNTIQKIGNPRLENTFPEMLTFLLDFKMSTNDVNAILTYHNESLSYSDLTAHEQWINATCKWFKTDGNSEIYSKWQASKIIRYDCKRIKCGFNYSYSSYTDAVNHSNATYVADYDSIGGHCLNSSVRPLCGCSNEYLTGLDCKRTCPGLIGPILNDSNNNTNDNVFVVNGYTFYICNGHGTCDIRSLSCECYENFVGDSCDTEQPFPTEAPTRKPTLDLDEAYDHYIPIQYNISNLTNITMEMIIQYPIPIINDIRKIIEYNYLNKELNLEYQSFYVNFQSINGKDIEDLNDSDDDQSIFDSNMYHMVLFANIESNEQDASILIKESQSLDFQEDTQGEFREYFNNSGLHFHVIDNATLESINKFAVTKEYNIFVYVLISFLVLVTIASVLAFAYNFGATSYVDDSDYLSLFIFGLQVFDFVSDINLCIEMVTLLFVVNNINDHLLLFIASIGSMVFIIIPFGINIWIATSIKNIVKANSSAVAYFEHNSSIFVSLVIISGCAYPSMSLLSSRIFAFEILNSGLTRFELRQLFHLKIFGNVCIENIEQLICQILYVIYLGTISKSIILSFMSSFLSIMCVILIYFISKKDGECIIYQYDLQLIKLNSKGNPSLQYLHSSSKLDKNEKEMIIRRKERKWSLAKLISAAMHTDESHIEFGKVTQTSNGFIIHLIHYVIKKDLEIILKQDDKYSDFDANIDIITKQFISTLYKQIKCDVSDAFCEHFNLDKNQFTVKQHSKYTYQNLLLHSTVDLLFHSPSVELIQQQLTGIDDDDYIYHKQTNEIKELISKIEIELIDNIDRNEIKDKLIDDRYDENKITHLLLCYNDDNNKINNQKYSNEEKEKERTNHISHTSHDHDNNDNSNFDDEYVENLMKTTLQYDLD